MTNVKKKIVQYVPRQFKWADVQVEQNMESHIKQRLFQNTT